MSLRRLRPKGGYYAHLVPEGKGTALCGFTPKSTVFFRRQMRHRCGWFIANPGTLVCPHCKTKSEKASEESKEKKARKG